MIELVLEFDGATPQSLALFDALPEALAGRSVRVEHRALATPGSPPWLALLAGEPPGRWACGEVLRRGPVEDLDELAMAVRRTPGALRAADEPVPAILWDGRRFAGDHALDDFIAALPPASPPPA